MNTCRTKREPLTPSDWPWDWSWAAQRDHRAAPNLQHCHGSRARWASHRGSSNRRPQPCSHAWSPQCARPWTGPGGSQRPPASHSPRRRRPSSRRTSAGSAERRRTSLPNWKPNTPITSRSTQLIDRVQISKFSHIWETNNFPQNLANFLKIEGVLEVGFLSGIARWWKGGFFPLEIQE